MVENIVDAIRTLHALGGRRVSVVNLPDLGLAPLTAFDPARRELLSRLVARHNRLLSSKLAKLESRLDGLNIVDIDLTEPLQSLPGVGFDIDAVPPSLFWDAEHPTTQAHYVLAQYILFRLQTG